MSNSTPKFQKRVMAGSGEGSAVPRAGMNRRQFLAASAATGAAGVGAYGLLSSSPAARAATPSGLTHSIQDLKHVVILMQENRSYDHYFGMLPGARGFGDKQALIYPDGTNVFAQPDASRSDGGSLLPFRLDTGTVNALGVASLDHGWPSYHQMWSNGAYNSWIPAKTQMCMGYYTEDDLPWQYAVAQAWMVADHYHCSIMGPTHPNRLYNYTGQIGVNGTTPQTTAAYDNNETSGLTWPTFAEQLAAAGVPYWNYQNNYSGDGFTGNWGNNAFEYFQIFQTWANSGNATQVANARAAGIGQPSASAPPANYQSNMNWVLSDFITACENNALPAVSWIASPAYWSEHPAEGDRGANYVGAVVSALASNAETWNSTLLIVNYDEADGMFDHVPPPFPEAGEPNEFLPAVSTYAAGHIGPGPRVPTMLISPWTRGGKVYSGLLDHTSSQTFIEYWLQETQGVSVTNPNITAWRRSLFDNLLGALDFENPDFSVPTLPDPSAILAAYAQDQTLPAAAPPTVGNQAMPVPATAAKSGPVTPVPSPYQQHADIAVDRSSGMVTATMSNVATPDGASTGVCHQVYPDAFKPFQATPLTVTPAAPRTYQWDATQTGGQYAFSIYGPDRFVRRFAGTVVAADQSLAGVGVITAALRPGSTPVLALTLANAGLNGLEFTLTPNDYAGTAQTLFVDGGQAQTVNWPTDPYGYYDVIVTDSSDTGLSHRYAGRIN